MSTTTTTSRRQQQDSDLERPSTFLDDDDDDDDDDLGDINVVFLDAEELDDDDEDEEPRSNPKGQELQKKRWSKLKPKFQKKRSNNKDRAASRPKGGKESAQDKKRRTWVA